MLTVQKHDRGVGAPSLPPFLRTLHFSTILFLLGGCRVRHVHRVCIIYRLGFKVCNVVHRRDSMIPTSAHLAFFLWLLQVAPQKRSAKAGVNFVFSYMMKTLSRNGTVSPALDHLDGLRPASTPSSAGASPVREPSSGTSLPWTIKRLQRQLQRYASFHGAGCSQGKYVTISAGAFLRERDACLHPSSTGKHLCRGSLLTRRP